VASLIWDGLLAGPWLFCPLDLNQRNATRASINSAAPYINLMMLGLPGSAVRP